MSREMDKCPRCGERVKMIEIDRYRMCVACRDEERKQ